MSNKGSDLATATNLEQGQNVTVPRAATSIRIHVGDLEGDEASISGQYTISPNPISRIRLLLSSAQVDAARSALKLLIRSKDYDESEIVEILDQFVQRALRVLPVDINALGEFYNYLLMCDKSNPIVLLNISRIALKMFRHHDKAQRKLHWAEICMEAIKILYATFPNEREVVSIYHTARLEREKLLDDAGIRLKQNLAPRFPGHELMEKLEQDPIPSTSRDMTPKTKVGLTENDILTIERARGVLAARKSIGETMIDPEWRSITRAIELISNKAAGDISVLLVFLELKVLENDRQKAQRIYSQITRQQPNNKEAATLMSKLKSE